MSSDRNDIHTLFADKWLARTFVKNTIGEHYLAKDFGCFDEAPRQRPQNLPRNFVVKVNHSSGGVIIVWDGAKGSTIPAGGGEPIWAGHVVHPDSLVWSDLAALVNKWLATSFYWLPGKLPEWAYKNIPRKVYFEELLIGPNSGLVEDYKFFMFDGKCAAIQHDKQRFSGHFRDMYSPTWDRLPVRYGHDISTEPSIRPTRLDEMLKVAHELSKDVDFVRVDLFLTADAIKFGEMTNYPDAGLCDFDPKSFNLWLGDQWPTKNGLAPKP
jgi:hypothetical protein